MNNVTKLRFTNTIPSPLFSFSFSFFYFSFPFPFFLITSFLSSSISSISFFLYFLPLFLLLGCSDGFSGFAPSCTNMVWFSRAYLIRQTQIQCVITLEAVEKESQVLDQFCSDSRMADSKLRVLGSR